jgi:hypothetical protein
VRDHPSLSPAASNNRLLFQPANSRPLAHLALMRRCLLAAAVAWSFLGPAVASACGAGIGVSDERGVRAIGWRPPVPHQLDLAADIAVQEKLFTTQAKDDQAKTETPGPARHESKSLASRFGLAFRASTLGVGGDAAFRIARPVNLRVGFNTFDYSRNSRSDGVQYKGSLRLRSLETIVDWFPFAGSFHVGSGALFFNGNRVTAVGTPPVGQVLTAGAQAYVSDPQNPLTGSAKSATRRIAPMVILGFGNLVPHNRHFAYSVDFGVVFQGAPKSTFTVGGGACDPSGEFCARAAEDSSIQAEAQSAQSNLDHHVSFLKYYPVMSVEFGYRF